VTSKHAPPARLTISINPLSKKEAMTFSIKAHPITRQAFESFGELITLENATTFQCNQGRAIRYDDLIQNIDVTAQHGRVAVSVYRCVGSPLPFPIEVMERHPLGSQAFMPMSNEANQRFLVAVASAGELNRSMIKAFIVPANVGIQYKKGVWHLPIVALDQNMDFFAVDRVGPGLNCDEIKFDSGYLIV
jgi:ureidoglycolate lyase